MHWIMNREQTAYEKGYRVTKDGKFLNPKGKKVGYIPKEICRYEYLNFIIKGKNRRIKTHRLQAYQKYGDKLFEDGIVVRHLNGNSLDNSFDNIAIGTYRDNTMDIPKEQRIKRTYAAAKTSIKYPKDFVLKLREEYKLIKNYSKLSRKYNIPFTTIFYLINKRKVFKDA